MAKFPLPAIENMQLKILFRLIWGSFFKFAFQFICNCLSEEFDLNFLIAKPSLPEIRIIADCSSKSQTAAP
jgi:hypothetical protein